MSSGNAYIKSLTDWETIGDWAAGFVGACVNEGIITGYEDKSFKPKNNFTRAETFAAVLRCEKVFRAIFNDARDYDSITVDGKSVGDGKTILNYGDVTITKTGSTLTGMVIWGDLEIAESVGDTGTVTLKNITVKGNTYIHGGGANSIIAQSCDFQTILINYPDKSVRLTLNPTGDADNKIQRILAMSNCTIDVTDKSSPNIVAAGGAPASAVVNIKGAVHYITVKAGCTVNLDGKASKLFVREMATNAHITLSRSSTISNAEFDILSTVSGGGTIANAMINSSGVNLYTRVTEVTRIPEIAGTPIIDANFMSLTSVNLTGTGDNLQYTALFDKGLAGGLKASEISVKGASLESISGSGNKYIFTLTDVTATGADPVLITIMKPGYTIKSATRGLILGEDTVSFQSLTADGSAQAATTKLTLRFDKVIEDFTVSDITLTGATKGALTGNGPEYTLAVSNFTSPEGTVTIGVSKDHYVISPPSRSAAVQRTSIGFGSILANGDDFTSTTEITIALGKDVPGFNVNDITLTGAAKGELTPLTNQAFTYVLKINSIGVPDKGEVEVTLSKAGVVFNPASAKVKVRNLTLVRFLTLDTNDGSDIITTSQLKVTFDKLIPEIVKGDFIVTGATLDSITSPESSTAAYMLTISNITVADGGNVKVEFKKAGYNADPPSRETRVRRTNNPVGTNAITPTVTPKSPTQFTVHFDKPVPNLTTADMTILNAIPLEVTRGSTDQDYTVTFFVTVTTPITAPTVTFNKQGFVFAASSLPASTDVSFTSAVSKGITGDYATILVTLSRTITLMKENFEVSQNGIKLSAAAIGAIRQEIANPSQYTVLIKIGADGIIFPTGAATADVDVKLIKNKATDPEFINPVHSVRINANGTPGIDPGPGSVTGFTISYDNNPWYTSSGAVKIINLHNVPSGATVDLLVTDLYGNPIPQLVLPYTSENIAILSFVPGAITTNIMIRVKAIAYGVYGIVESDPLIIEIRV
ncbi:hypothetical protein FACS1894105_11950 [Clostridia bacterium]|nr:hypothetical protein FACS1894105_11950 [Clostridia bacterium]